MTVNEILAKRRYVDRRRRVWEESYYSPKWKHRIGGILGEDYLWLTRDQMRLLIERDLHRDECEGLHGCGDHPVHHAVFYRWERAFRVYEPDPNSVETIRCETLPEAMDAARAWAVGE